MALVSDDCGLNRLYIFNNESERWNEIHHPDFDNSDFLNLVLDENSNLIGKVFSCGWNYLSPIDSVWSPIYTPGLVAGNQAGYLQNYLATERKDFGFNAYTLYSTDNYGKSWDSVRTFNQGITGLHYFGNGYILLHTKLNGYSFYISKDYGENFDYVTSSSIIDFPVHAFKLDFDQKLIATNPNTFNGSFYYLDEGSKSWKIDNRFGNLMCRGFEFAEDGRYFVDVEVNGLRGLYSTYDFKSFYNITDQLGYTFAYSFKYLGNGQLVFACNNQDGIRGVYYSNDYGVTLQDITYDLKYMRDDLQYGSVSGFLLDRDQKLIVRMNDNGIYRLSEPIASSSNKDLEDNNNTVFIYPQPVLDILQIQSEKNFEFDHFIILNAWGKVIMRSRLDQNQIVLNTLTTGFYYLQLMNNNRVLWAGSFMKS